LKPNGNVHNFIAAHSLFASPDFPSTIGRRSYGASGLIILITRMCLRMRTIDMSEEQEKSATIRDLNDRFRRNIPTVTDVPGQVVLTSGIQELTNTDAEPGKHLLKLFHTVRSFDDFTKDNDPYGEHDFGALDFEGARVFWKFDYYAPGMMHGTDDPTDTAKTVRVLTIMLAEEY